MYNLEKYQSTTIELVFYQLCVFHTTVYFIVFVIFHKIMQYKKIKVIYAYRHHSICTLYRVHKVPILLNC